MKSTPNIFAVQSAIRAYGIWYAIWFYGWREAWTLFVALRMNAFEDAAVQRLSH